MVQKIENNNGKDIYRKVKQKLIELDSKKNNIQVYQVLDEIQNFRIGKMIIEELNLPPTVLDRISIELSRKLRFNRNEARYILKQFCDEGFLIRGKAVRIQINKHS